MAVTVLPQTNATSGRGTKFKVSAVMMTRSSAMGFAWPEEATQFMAQDIFSGEFGKIGLESDEDIALNKRHLEH